MPTTAVTKFSTSNFVGDGSEEAEDEDGEERAGNEADGGHAQLQHAVELGRGDGDPDAREPDQARDDPGDADLDGGQL